MKQPRPADPLTVECPYCHAEPGARCIRAELGTRGDPHGIREAHVHAAISRVDWLDWSVRALPHVVVWALVMFAVCRESAAIGEPLSPKAAYEVILLAAFVCCWWRP